jgi:gamma-glutamylcyclotransferase (GGCT)/AIG2-like uncharacterized protein YtfP
MEKLFIYGTLRNKDIRQKITGRDILSAGQAKLEGYLLSKILIGETEYPIICNSPNANEWVEGEIIEVSKPELLLLDGYEGEEYRRIKVKLQNGMSVWAYTL